MAEYLDEYEIEPIKTGNKKGKVGKIHSKKHQFFFWPYEDQTKIKHLALNAYFKPWSTILSAFGNINYYDGFCGCGAYVELQTKEIGYGSPVLAISSMVENNTNNKCKFFISDKEQSHIDNIKKVLKYNNIYNHNNIFIEQGDFDIKINAFLDKLEKHPIPTFFLIDPYGIKDVKYSTLKRIMKIPKTEILLNFMYNYLNRFLTQENSAQGISELYGCDDWKNIRDLKEQQKEEALVELFRNQLKEFSKFVYQYRLSFQDQNKTYYYLFHLTNHYKGCSIMKDSFASVNFGNVEFLGPNQPNPAQLCLIDQTELKQDVIKNDLFNKYKGKKVIFEDILQEYIDNSPFLERQIKKAIEAMEEEFLKIERIGTNSKGVRKKGLKPNDKITFFSNPKIIQRAKQISLFD